MRAAVFATVITSVVGIILSLVLIFPVAANAKDLTNRLGVGYSNDFSNSVPSLAVRYFPNSKVAVGAALGVDSEQGSSKFGFQVNVHRVVFTEDNLNFFMGSSAGLISTQTSGSSTQSGFELAAFVGCQFFFTGLDNLGFNFDAGMGVDSISSQVRVRTIGETPFQAGMLFYF